MANCKGCGAPLNPHEPNCSFCGVRNVVDKDVISSTTTAVPQEERTCPNCKIALKTVDVGEGSSNFYIENCEECGGLFFDNGELHAILDQKVGTATQINFHGLQDLMRQPLESNLNVVYRPCPICGEIMNREKFGEKSGVVIDHCHQHGIWLEPGELTRLTEWKRQGGEILDARRKYQDEQAKLKQDRERVRNSAGAYSGSGEAIFGGTSSYNRQQSFGTGIEIVDVISEIAGWFFKR